MATEPIPDRVIGTPKPISRTTMRRASLVFIGLSLPVILIGIETWRLGIARWIAVIMLAAAIPMFLLGTILLFWSPAVPVLAVTASELVASCGKKKRTIVRLADIAEILLAGPQSAPGGASFGLRIPTIPELDRQRLILLKTPYDDLADSAKREIGESAIVYNRAVKILHAGAYQESALALGQALLRGASDVQGRPVALRELTADGPEDLSEHRLAVFGSPDTGAPNPPTTVAPVGTRCVECDFDLRQRSWESECPECGTPVRQSAEGHLLRVADRGWLQKIRRGAGTLSVGWSMALAAIFLPAMARLASGRPRGGRPPLDMQVLAVIGVALGMAYLFIAIGTWYLTAKEPRYTEHADDPRIRRIARCMIPLPLAVGLFLMATTVPAGRMRIMILIALAVLAWSTLLLTARLLHRVPHRGWALAAQAVAGLLFMCAWLPVTFVLLKYIDPWLPQSTPAVASATQPAPIDQSTVLRIVMSALGVAFISLLFVSLAGSFWKLHAAVRNIIAEGNQSEVGCDPGSVQSHSPP